MTDLFAKCGANCGRCPAYRENIITDEDRQRCSDGWHKYLGARIKPDRIRCDGCQTPDDENPALIIRSCNVRKCALINGVQTCAHCSKYPCEDLERLGATIDPESVMSRFEAPIPEEDYLAFLEPYELLKHLDSIRASLKPGDLVEPTRPRPFRPKTLGFPDNLALLDGEASGFRALHRTLKTINSVEAESHVMQVRLKARREYFLKLLWTFGLLGELQDDGGLHLVLDGDVYYEQKLFGHYDTVVNRRFKILEEYGIHCEHIPLGEGWLTPSGWMKRRTKRWDKGFLVTMAFDDEAGGETGLRALRAYVTALHEEYGERAFRYFSRADMRVLGEA
jgi:hypothetical protein